MAAMAAASGASAAVGALVDGWQPRGDGTGASATWQGRGGDPFVRIRCNHGDPRLDLRITSATLPADLHQVTLVADEVGVDYPVERSGASLAARIALDAPILDRMLVARQFAIVVGGRSLSTGLPGETLARVVRACRALHWPREARIDPSDAGLAKK